MPLKCLRVWNVILRSLGFWSLFAMRFLCVSVCFCAGLSGFERLRRLWFHMFWVVLRALLLVLGLCGLFVGCCVFQVLFERFLFRCLRRSIRFAMLHNGFRDFHRSEGELAMPKGKPWTKEEERTLIQLVKKRKGIDVIAKVLGKNEDMIYHKMRRLGLRVEVGSETNQPPSSSQASPKELPSIENVMIRLSAALKALEQPGIDKKEIIRLRCFIQGKDLQRDVCRLRTLSRDRD